MNPPRCPVCGMKKEWGWCLNQFHRPESEALESTSPKGGGSYATTDGKAGHRDGSDPRCASPASEEERRELIESLAAVEQAAAACRQDAVRSQAKATAARNQRDEAQSALAKSVKECARLKEELADYKARHYAELDEASAKGAEAMGFIRYAAHFYGLAGEDWSEEPGFAAKLMKGFTADAAIRKATEMVEPLLQVKTELAIERDALLVALEAHADITRDAVTALDKISETTFSWDDANAGQRDLAGLISELKAFAEEARTSIAARAAIALARKDGAK